MGIFNKLGIGAGAGSNRETGRQLPSEQQKSSNGNGLVAAVGSHRAPEPGEVTRVSNGLKEFLWSLDGLGRGTLLDLGPAWQTTLNFFIDRGFRVTSDDMLREWSQFLADEEAKDKTRVATPENYAERTPEARATRFLAQNLQYPPSSFDALLLWDILDYLEPTLAKLLVAQLTELLRPGAAVFAMFHSKKPEGFQRYRVADTNTIQVLSSKAIFPAQKVYQNREIQDLFGRYRSVKSFVGRDQLRENLFIK
jgi:hypothetical protein